MRIPTRPGRYARVGLLAGVTLLGGAAALAPFPTWAQAMAPQSDTAIKSLRTVRSQARAGATDVAVEVTSKRPFLPGSLSFVLQIGDRQYRHYLYPKNGSLNTIIFYIPQAEFARTQSGQPVTVYYDRPSRDPRDLGKLDKSLLNR